ncbi:MAG: UDP-N-acetylmuramyl-tripeptide synthetase, partial [Candidatus Omnitrophica bacterium]|nr:UDP-N-acetylmuramyl-tripeptide synthetase [Candidatus Omnitrophota bacterium]
AIINTDDAYGRRLAGLIKNNKKNKVNIISYGIKNKADIIAKDIYFDCNGSRFMVEGLKHKFSVETNLIGVFNVYNALASIAASLALGIPPKYIAEGLKSVFVPGRLEKIICRQKDISIFVDYAHTEDGLKNILLSLNELKVYGRLIVVFGCGGNRDKGKRPLMGKVASELADFTIITSDNPRFENPKSIISDIKKGISRKNYICIADRKDAIEKSIEMAREGDVVLVAGKGHEDYQIIKDKKFAFNDRLVIEAILDKLG